MPSDNTPERLIVISKVPLDPSCGAGMKAACEYLDGTKLDIHSIYFDRDPVAGNDRAHWHKIGLGTGLLRFIRAFFKIFDLTIFDGDNCRVLVIPNGMEEILMGLAARLRCDRVCVWYMDDFLGFLLKGAGRIKQIVFSSLFALLYQRANRVLVISQAMGEDYFKRFHRQADRILPKGATHHRPAKTTFGRPLRLVNIGTYQSFYLEPLRWIREYIALKNSPLTLVHYGPVPAPADILLDTRITYGGCLDPETLVETLHAFDVATLTYSWDEDTIRFMRLSFPSKLVDYVATSLPVLACGPDALSFFSEFRERKIGWESHSKAELFSALDELSAMASSAGNSEPTLFNYSVNSEAWGRDAFDFPRLQRQFFRSLWLYV